MAPFQNDGCNMPLRENHSQSQYIDREVAIMAPIPQPMKGVLRKDVDAEWINLKNDKRIEPKGKKCGLDDVMIHA